jgi:hypothetical protein
MVCLLALVGRQGQQTRFVSHPSRPENDVHYKQRHWNECVIFIWSPTFWEMLTKVLFAVNAEFMEYFLLQFMKLVWTECCVVVHKIKNRYLPDSWLSAQVVQTHLPVDSQKNFKEPIWYRIMILKTEMSQRTRVLSWKLLLGSLLRF